MADKTYIMIVRHAEAYKNLNEIIGGIGTGLSYKGYKQINDFYEKNKAFFLNKNINIYSTRKQQLFATAYELNKNIKGKMHIYDYIHPLNMGVFNGVTESYAKTMYPESYKLLTKWRDKSIDISMLKIPEMGSYNDFWEEGKLFVKYINNNSVNIVICSTSVFILLANIMLGRNIYKKNEYKCINVNTMDYMTFIKNNNNYYLVKALSSKSVILDIEKVPKYV